MHTRIYIVGYTRGVIFGYLPWYLLLLHLDKSYLYIDITPPLTYITISKPLVVESSYVIVAIYSF